MTTKGYLIFLVAVLAFVGFAKLFVFVKNEYWFKFEKPLLKLGISSPEILIAQLLEGHMHVKKAQRIAYLSYTEFPTYFVSGQLNDGESGGLTCEIPHGVDLAWVSWSEKKIYKLDTQFPEEMIQEIQELVETGIVDKYGDHIPYRILRTEIFPHGQVRFSLLAYTTFRSLEWTFQAEETHEYDDKFLQGTDYDSASEYFNSFVNFALENVDPTDKRSWKNYIVDNRFALDADLWNSHYKRYDYSIEFDFSDAQDSLYFWAPWFSNGDHFACKKGVNDSIVWNNTSVLCELSFWWRDSEYQYIANSYYNENEITEVFNKAFDDHAGERGTLLFQMKKSEGKYENIDILLKIGDSVYPIGKTEMLVSRRSLSDRNEGSDIVFKNFEGERKNDFIGL